MTFSLNILLTVQNASNSPKSLSFSVLRSLSQHTLGVTEIPETGAAPVFVVTEPRTQFIGRCCKQTSKQREKHLKTGSKLISRSCLSYALDHVYNIEWDCMLDKSSNI